MPGRASNKILAPHPESLNPEELGGMGFVADVDRAYKYHHFTPYGAYDYYLGEQEGLWNGHLQHLEDLHANLTPSSLARPPKVVVAIPVAGHQESAFIKQTLQQYGKQLLSKDLWEMVLFVNSPASDLSDFPTSTQATLEQIAEAKREYGLTNLRVMTHVYDRPQPMGKIRKDLWDTIVLDMHERRADSRVLVINNDSDTAHLRPDYVTEIAYPHIVNGAGQIRGPLRFASLPAAPTASRLIRFHFHMYNAFMYKNGHRPTVEGNSAFDLAAYCAIGGFDPTKMTNEYNDLNSRVGKLNADRLTYIYEGDEAWAPRAPLKTSARRQLATIAMKHSLNHTWNTDKVPFTSFDSLREVPPAEAAEAVAQTLLGDFIHADLAHFRFTRDTPANREFNEEMDRFGITALRLTGLLDAFCNYELAREEKTA